MPELPEVETVARAIRRLRGLRISAFELLRADYLRAGLEHAGRVAGMKIHSIDRRAKRIIVELTDESRLFLIVHLGMSGRVAIEPKNAPRLKHTHAAIHFVESDVELRFVDPRRFGGLWLFEKLPVEPVRFVGPLGPDALNVSTSDLEQILKRQRQIKALLMDQTAIGGLGNIYVDESLHRAGIHPLSIASRIRPGVVHLLARSIRAVLRDALKYQGSTLRDYRTADGAEGGYQTRHKVYGRTGKPCRKCGTKIRRIIAAGRSTHFCPTCQRKRN